MKGWQSCLGSCVIPLVIFTTLSCDKETIVDTDFQTTVHVTKNQSGCVFENEIKFSMMDQLQGSMKQFGILPGNITIDSYNLYPSPSCPTNFDQAYIKAKVFVKVVCSESDIDNEANMFLLLETPDNTTFGHFRTNHDDYVALGRGVLELNRLFVPQENLEISQRIKFVDLIFHICFIDNTDLSGLNAFDLTFTANVTMHKYQ